MKMTNLLSLRSFILVLALLTPAGLVGQSSDDPIYTASQVDVKAKVKNQLENLPDAENDCSLPVAVSLRVVLRKSGKVTDVSIVKSSGCSYDQEAVRVAKKLKFDAAIKSGQRVSQYSDIEYKTTSRIRR